MTFQEFWGEVTKAWDAAGQNIRNPDEYDVFGTAAGGVQAYYEYLGKQMQLAQKGLLPAATAVKLADDFIVMADRMDAIGRRLARIPLPDLGEAERAIKGRINQLALDMRYWGKQVHAAAGSGNIAALSQKVTFLGHQLGAGLALIQFGDAIYSNGGGTAPSAAAAALAQKATGVLIGIAAGAKGGAALGFLAGTATANPVGIGAATVLGALGGAYLGGTLGETGWEIAYQKYLEKIPALLDAGEQAKATVTLWATGVQEAWGLLDGTWLTSKGTVFTPDEKVGVTVALASTRGVELSAAAEADLKKLFTSNFAGDGLVGRDILIRSLLSLASEAAYDTEIITVNAANVTVDFPEGARAALGALREFAGSSLDESDKAGWAITGPGRVVIALSAGTHAASEKGSLLIGSSGVDGLIGGAGNDDIVGGAGQDTLLGMEGADDVFGGADDDLLDGGAGGDWLYGGTGNDTYQLSAGELGDVIVDSDGNGRITIDGVQLTGGKKLVENYWTSDDRQWGYTLSANGDLVVSKGTSPDRITIRNWGNLQGKLGITLDGTQATAPQATRNFTGDFVKLTRVENDVEVYVFQDGNYVSDGAQPGAADLITGSADNDDIHGLGGNDALLGSGGDDKVQGGDGNDILMGGVGADTLIGGVGSDLIYGSSTGGLVYPTRVDSTLQESSAPIIIAEGLYWRWSTFGPDQEGFTGGPLSGTVQRDQQAGDSGNVIDAGAGDDTVYAGSGNDVVHGGEGRDEMIGMGGNDDLFGGDGIDRIQGDSHANDVPSSVIHTAAELHGSDYVDGGAGDDILMGQGGADSIIGGLDNDLMFGDDRDKVRTPVAIHGNDYLDGGDGLDRLVGGGRDDELFGGGANDMLWGDSGEADEVSPLYIPPELHGNDYLDGEDGDDILNGEGRNDTLFGGTGNDELSGDGYSKVEVHGNDYLDGEDGDDKLWGDGGDDELFGGAGADTLTGDTVVISGDKHGRDYLDGEAGMDTLAGSGGDDMLFGGTENDVLYGDDGMTDAVFHGHDYLDGEDGDDELVGGGGKDTLFGGIGHDRLFGDDSALAVTWHGNDYLDGEAGNDSMVGGGGNDTLVGGEGDDVLYGDADGLAGGDDWIYGGAGNDQMRGHSGNDLLDGGEGADLMLGDEGDDALSGGSGNDQLQGELGADVLAGGMGMDTLFGGADDDALYGNEDADWLQAEAGNDLVEGGEGNDSLLGGDGNDTLIGGAGFDHLQGDAGDDTYVFEANDTTNDPSLAEFVNDTVGTNHIRLNGMSISSMNLTPFSGLGGNDFMLETGQGTIFIRGLSTGAIATVNVSGVTYTSGQFFGNTYAWSADQSTSTNGAVLQGGKLGDSLTSTGGNSTLAGGLGSDLLAASGGNNTYVYEAGDGADVIDDTSSANQKGTLRFGTGITPDQVKLNYSGSRLIISFGELAGSIEITGFDPNNAATSGGIGLYQFADGTVLTHAQLVLRGFDLSFTSSDDVVSGTSEQDRITGGAGDDTLIGKGGADTYTFNAGDGSDLIADGDAAAGTGDILRFGEAITASSVKAMRNGNDVIFVIGTDQLTLRNYFTGGSDAVERILFANGAEWTQTDVNAVIAASGSLDFTLVGTDGNDNIRGLAGNDFIDGRAGRDTLFGGSGNDTLAGGTGDDFLIGGPGSDTYIVRRGEDSEQVNETESGDATSSDVVRFEGISRQDTVVTRYNNNVIFSSSVGTPFSVTIYGQLGSNSPADQVERFEFADGTVLTAQQVRQLALDGTLAPDNLGGTLVNDSIDAFWGNDTVRGYSGNDTLQGSQGDDTLYGDQGDDSLLGGADQDLMYGGDGNDTLQGGTGWDSMDGGNGNDTYSFGIGQGMEIVQADASGADQVLLAAGITAANVTLRRVSSPPSNSISFAGDSLVIQLNGGNDQLWIANYFATATQGYVETVRFQDGTVWDYAAVTARLASLGGTANTITGTRRANTFTVDHWNDIISDPEPTDVDSITTSVSYTIPDSVSNLTMTGGLNLFANVNDYSNIVRGNTGHNWFTFKASSGGDVLYGGAGDDIYVMQPEAANVEPDTPVLNTSAVSEVAGEGNDTLISGWWSVQMPNNVENLTWAKPNPYGGALYYYPGVVNNYLHRIVGNGSNNLIDLQAYEADAYYQGWYQYVYRDGFKGLAEVRVDGGAGADTMVGGVLGDTYVVDDLGDVIIEATAGGWADTVETPFETSLLTQYAQVENVTLTGSQAVGARGNAGANRLDGSKNAAANVLEGGDGNDTYVVGIGDVVVESGNGNDTVIVAAGSGGTTFSLANLGTVENGRVSGGAGALNLEGNALSNVLNGNESNNTIRGGDGDDYIDDQYAPDFTFTGAGLVVETKPASDADVLIGGSGNDTITSRGGSDTMDGGAGDDTLKAVYYTARAFVVKFGDGYGHDVFSGDTSQSLTIEMTSLTRDDITLQEQNGVFSVRTPDGSVIEMSSIHYAGIRLSGGVYISPAEIDAILASQSAGAGALATASFEAMAAADTGEALATFELASAAVSTESVPVGQAESLRDASLLEQSTRLAIMESAVLAAAPAPQVEAPSAAVLSFLPDAALEGADGAALSTAGRPASVTASGGVVSQSVDLTDLYDALAALDADRVDVAAGNLASEAPLTTAGTADSGNVATAVIQDKYLGKGDGTGALAAPVAAQDREGIDALVAWMRTQAEIPTSAANGDTPLMQHAWDQLDAWLVLEQALSPLHAGDNAAVDLGSALYGQILPFGDASRAGVTTALSAASRMEQVAQFQVAQAL